MSRQMLRLQQKKQPQLLFLWLRLLLYLLLLPNSSCFSLPSPGGPPSSHVSAAGGLLGGAPLRLCSHISQHPTGARARCYGDLLHGGPWRPLDLRLEAQGASSGLAAELPVSDAAGKAAATAEAPAGVEAKATEASAATSAAAAATEIENAFVGVVAAAAAALTADVQSSDSSSSSSSSSRAHLALWPDGAAPVAVEEARVSFLKKVAKGFRLKGVDDANGVVYVHRSGSSSSGRLLVDRQLLLRLRGQQQKGSWALHFLGTGAMQASVRPLLLLGSLLLCCCCCCLVVAAAIAAAFAAVSAPLAAIAAE